MIPLLCSVSARADLLTFANGVSANPPSVPLNNGTTIIPDTLQLSTSAVWGVILSQTLDAQGFTAANGWNYSLMNITPLANDANYNVTTYKASTPNGVQSSETVQWDWKVGSTVDPTGGKGTLHWLQLINEDQPYPSVLGGNKPFGFQIAGQPGYWQVDNDDMSWAKGVGPYYDSNSPAPTPFPNFYDMPTQTVPAGGYLHFWTIPVWDLAAGGMDTMYAGDPGISWGFTVVTPEPSTFTMIMVAAAPGLVITWYRRRRNEPFAPGDVSADS